MGFLWLACWLVWYGDPERHHRLSPTQLAYIRSDGADPVEVVPWRRLIGRRQTWAYIIGKALTDPVWLFYLFWLPNFRDANWGVRLAGLAAPLIVLIAAVSIVPTMVAPSAGSMWAAVGIVCAAAGAHQWWSTNLFTTVSDMFPRRAVGSVVGIGGCAGRFSAFGFQRLTGTILATGGNYAPVFAVLGLVYVIALLIVHLLVPRLEPVGTPPARALRRALPKRNDKVSLSPCCGGVH